MKLSALHEEGERNEGHKRDRDIRARANANVSKVRNKGLGVKANAGARREADKFEKKADCRRESKTPIRMS